MYQPIEGLTFNVAIHQLILFDCHPSTLALLFLKAGPLIVNIHAHVRWFIDKK